MAKKNKINTVNVTQEGQRTFDKMIKFIQENQQNPQAEQRFRDNFKKKVEQIKEQPNSCPTSTKREGTRRALFDKFGAFLYRVYKNSIRIVTFFDTRSKP